MKEDAGLWTQPVSKSACMLCLKREHVKKIITLSQESVYKGYKSGTPADKRGRITHNASQTHRLTRSASWRRQCTFLRTVPNLLHLHTSGQMRETYGFGTCRSIPTTFFFPPKISLPLSSSGKYYRAKSARLSASGESVKTQISPPKKKQVKRLFGFYSGEEATVQEEIWVRLCALHWASVIKRVKRSVRQSAVSHPVQHHSAAQLQLSAPENLRRSVR